jgi:hypothetical protein
MAQYRKKPVVIEAITFEELVEYGKTQVAPEHLNNGMPWSFNYAGHPITHENDECYLIPTLEGTHNFTPADMLITGVNGEIYPCKIDIFIKTYDPVENDNDYNCEKCHGTTKHSYCCENPACPNMPCCGKPLEECKCTYNPQPKVVSKKQLEAAYKKALDDNKESFIFDGDEYLVEYAKYLLEYLETLNK